MELEEDMDGVGSVPGAACARVRVTEETCLVCVNKYKYKAVVDFVCRASSGGSVFFVVLHLFRFPSMHKKRKKK